MALERIPVRHYRFRDLPQIRARINLRRGIALSSSRVGTHWARERVAQCLIADDHPLLRLWEPGQPLPLCEDWPEPRSHLNTSATARVRGVCHRIGLAPLLDLVPSRRARDTTEV
jgi:hypothetical protein